MNGCLRSCKPRVSCRCSLIPSPANCMAGINGSLSLICLHLENGIIKPWGLCEARSWQGDILMISLVDFSRRPGTGMEMSSPTKWSWVEWNARGQSYPWHTATTMRRWPAPRVGCGSVLESPAQKVRLSKGCLSLFPPVPSSRGVQGTIGYSSQDSGVSQCVTRRGKHSGFWVKGDKR